MLSSSSDINPTRLCIIAVRRRAGPAAAPPPQQATGRSALIWNGNVDGGSTIPGKYTHMDICKARYYQTKAVLNLLVGTHLGLLFVHLWFLLVL
jgi:hypothetical protein